MPTDNKKYLSICHQAPVYSQTGDTGICGECGMATTVEKEEFSGSSISCKVSENVTVSMQEEKCPCGFPESHAFYNNPKVACRGWLNDSTPEEWDWSKEFDEKLAGVFEWIVLNCKDEIVDGVDMNHLPEILKSFIRQAISKARERARQEERERVINDLATCAGRREVGDRQFHDVLRDYSLR